MEDTGRGLAGNQVITSQTKGKTPSCKEYTIMLIGNIGKIRSFKISRRLLLFLLGFLCFYLLSSIIIIYLYSGSYIENRENKEAIKSLESALSEKSSALDQNKLYTEGLEDYIKNLPKAADDSKKAEQKKGVEPKQVAAPADSSEIPVKGDDIAPPKEAETSSVDVRDFEFRVTDLALTVECKLANNLTEQTPAEGYIHIFAIDKNGAYPPEWNKNPERLRDGVPTDYKTGQVFLIQRFKSYQRQYKMLADFELPSLIRILVYDRSGQKILEKEIPVIDVPANDKD